MRGWHLLAHLVRALGARQRRHQLGLLFTHRSVLLLDAHCGLARREAGIGDGCFDGLDIRLGARSVNQGHLVFIALDFYILDAGKVIQTQLSPMLTQRSRNAGDLHDHHLRVGGYGR